MTPGTNRRRPIFGAVDLCTGRFLYQVTRKAVSASFTAFLEQLLAAYPAAPMVAVVGDNVIIHHSKLVQGWLAAHRRLRCWMAPATARMTTRSSGSGPRQGVAGQLADADHPRPPPPGACLLRPAQPHPNAGDRRAAQLTVAAHRLRAELQAGRLG
jgi:DDE superfamily endonuclease